MNSAFSDFVVNLQDKLIDALTKINSNKQGFVIVIDDNEIVTGVLTDGDIRRAMIKGLNSAVVVSEVYTRSPKTISVHNGFDIVIDIFKNQSIKFLPILNDDGTLANIITKAQMHALLLTDTSPDLTYDFLFIDTSVIDYEIFPRPWGFYKTTVLTDYYQGKVISVKPGGKLSLQSHKHREEHWIVVHGNGIVQLDDSLIEVHCGSSVFIPKGCKHRLTNTDQDENLIISEVQIGDYLGEDDIIRYDDIYGRAGD